MLLPQALLPLALGALRVLADDLATVLPGHRVITAPWSASAAPHRRVRVAIDRFGLQPDGGVSLSGRFVLLPGSGERPLVTRVVDLRRPPESRDPARAVEAMSALLADLAAEIAKAVAALPADTEMVARKAAADPASPR